MIEKIERLHVKSVWQYEDRNFTPWLCENIDVVSDAIGRVILNPEREQSTGNFNVDIKAEDEEGNIVIIENQFGNSDHPHLGKLITYLASFETTKVAIWIVETPKQEHINAINWLNESSRNCDFYLLTIEAIRIGNSSPAPLLTKIVGPSEESKRIGKIKKEDSEKHKRRFEFWSQLLSTAKKKGLRSFDAISPTKDSFVSATSGTPGLAYLFWTYQNYIRIELRIDKGKGYDEENLRIFDKLKEKKNNIEERFGSELVWADLEGYRTCSIRKDFDLGGYVSDASEWEQIIQNAISMMSSLITATKPHIKTAVQKGLAGSNDGITHDSLIAEN